MDVKVQVSGEKATLSLSGRFDFTAHKEFRQHAERTVQNNGITGVEVDLSGVEYLDSSALGMLLLLKENAEKSKQSVSLINCQGAVRRILEVANFDKLFRLG